MSDRDHIVALIKRASDPDVLVEAQHTAAQKLLHFDGEIYPSDGCAITQSCLLQEAGIEIPDTFQALAFGEVLKKRGWQVVPVGKQEAGDIGSTCGSVARHGDDHVYLVLRAVNADEMVIADNQAHAPHLRFASGKEGKTPTRFFLRAPSAPAETAIFLRPPVAPIDTTTREPAAASAAAPGPAPAAQKTSLINALEEAAAKILEAARQAGLTPHTHRAS